MGAPSPRTLAAIVFLLAFAGAQADLTDVNSACDRIKEDGKEHEESITRTYCRVTDLTNRTLGWLGRHDPGYVGWGLVLFHHALSTTKRVAERKGLFKDGDGGDIGSNQKSRLDELMRIVRLAGQNMLVYMCYYADKERMSNFPPGFNPPLREQPFMHSCFVVMIDVFVLWGIRSVIEMLILPEDNQQTQPNTTKTTSSLQDRSPKQKSKFQGVLDGTTSEEDKGNRVWELETIYSLPTVPPLRFVLTWVSQTLLFFYYVLVMNKISIVLENNIDDGSTFMWSIGVVIMITVGEKEAGETFDFSGWGAIYNAWNKARKDNKPISTCTTLHVLFRGFCDWSVNSIYRQIILATTPILLSTEEPLDFIKDVLAIMFISTLDDPTDDQQDQAKEAFYKHAKEAATEKQEEGGSTELLGQEKSSWKEETEDKKQKEAFLKEGDEGGCTTEESAKYMLNMLDNNDGPALGICVALDLWHTLLCPKWCPKCCGGASRRPKHADAKGAHEPLLTDAHN